MNCGTARLRLLRRHSLPLLLDILPTRLSYHSSSKSPPTSSKRVGPILNNKATPPPRKPALSPVKPNPQSTIGSTAASDSASASSPSAAQRAQAREASLRAGRLRRQQQGEGEERKAGKEDTEEIKKKERYEKARKAWIRTMIALPIFLVSSYYLWDRVVMGTPMKVLPKEYKEKTTADHS